VVQLSDEYWITVFSMTQGRNLRTSEDQICSLAYFGVLRGFVMIKLHMRNWELGNEYRFAPPFLSRIFADPALLLGGWVRLMAYIITSYFKIQLMYSSEWNAGNYFAQQWPRSFPHL
jgi:hypothetical protein